MFLRYKLVCLILLLFTFIPFHSAFAETSKQDFTAAEWLEIGNDYALNRKDYDNAIQAYNEALRLDPHFVGAYYNRGNAYQCKGEQSLAIADYDRAIALNPKLALAYYNRGNCHFVIDHFALALDDYNQTIALCPEYALAYFSRGNIYKYTGQYALAIADYDRAIALNPKLPLVYYNLGNIYLYQGLYDQAIDNYTQTVAIPPNPFADYRPIAYYGRGNAHEYKGEYELAITDYDLAIKIHSRYLDAYYRKALVCEKLGRTNEAIASYQLFLKYAPPYYANIESAKQRVIDLGGSL